jgi:serine/threonine protein kinase/Tol biopolymer transport system component
VRGPRDFERAEELYHAALARPAAERQPFLRQACGGDDRLLHDVNSLLGYEEEAKRLLEEPIADAATQEFAVLRGTRLGPYEVHDLLGAGGMGAVYRARDTRLGREVAIKVLHEAAAGDSDQLQRFDREARAAAALNHPNIATIYEIGEHERRRFISMERVEGRTLKERLQEGPLAPKQLLELAIQLARGLAKAHEAGIVHRDLKPGNLMVTSDGLLKILDFGLAKRTPRAADLRSGVTREGMVLGTVQYMSPEQAAARPLDHRSDQFSFGAILYEMATGRRAFERETAPQTLAAIIEDEPEPIRDVGAEIPAGLSAIVDRCLAKDPARRYASTADLVKELALVPASSVPARIGGSRRSPMVAGLALLVAITIVVLSRRALGPDAPESPRTRPAVPLTAYPGREAEPTFSPDASLVAFTWNGDAQDNHDIYVKAIGSEQPLRLTSDPARDGSPAWSPDGTRIAFLREKSGAGSEVRLIPPTGGPERRLEDVQSGADWGLAWSPDGRYLAVVDRESPDANPGIFLLDTGSGVKTRVTVLSPFRDVLPAFSPDGRRIAFNRTILPRGPFVFVVPTAGGDHRELAPTGLPRGRVAWSRSGEDIIFAAGAGQGGPSRPASGAPSAGALWTIPARGGEARLLESTTNAVDVVVSEARRRLVYSQETSDLDIFRLDLGPRGSSAEAQTRFIASTKADTNPQFSPDGGRVAFTSFRSGQQEIWVADANGMHALRLTSLGGEGAAACPRWSPDGRSIAFDFGAAATENVDIYVISSSGGPPRRVTTSPAIDATPSWSRDGRFIYFQSNREDSWQVWKVPATGAQESEARRVTRGGGSHPIESIDARHVYFARMVSGSAALWRIPVEGGDEEVVVEAFQSSATNWDVTAEGLYFVDRAAAPGLPWVVRFQAFGQRHATDLARLRYPPNLGAPAVSVSSDGRWFLSTQVREESDLMLIEDFR